jgi:hypothetical protein
MVFQIGTYLAVQEECKAGETAAKCPSLLRSPWLKLLGSNCYLNFLKHLIVESNKQSPLNDSPY